MKRSPGAKCHRRGCNRGVYAGHTRGQGIGWIGETTVTGAEGAHGLLLLRAHRLIRGSLPQLIDADEGDTAVRLRTVRNPAPPSATRAVAAAAPTAALPQSNPSLAAAGEAETDAGSLAGDPAIAISEEGAGSAGRAGACFSGRPQ
jgi:hypothetical protein